MDKAATHIHVFVCVWTQVFVSLRKTRRTETAESHGKCWFPFLRDVKLSSKVAEQICIPTSNIQKFQLLHSLASTWHCQFWGVLFLIEPFSLVYNGMCGLIRICLLTNDVECFFMCLIAIHVSSLKEVFVWIFCHPIFKWVACFLITEFWELQMSYQELNVCWYCWGPVVTGCIGFDGRFIHSLHLSHRGHIARGLWASARWDWNGGAEEGGWLAFTEWIILSNWC